MGTLDAPDKSRGVSFQLAIGPVSCAKTARWKLTPLSNALLSRGACEVLGVGSVSWGGEFFREDGVKTIHNPTQQRLFDPFEGVIGAATWKQIHNGWLSMIRGVLLEQMPVQRLADGTSDSQRPLPRTTVRRAAFHHRADDDSKTSQLDRYSDSRSDSVSIRHSVRLKPRTGHRHRSADHRTVPAENAARRTTE
jgi:hypothetical protein